MEYYDKQGIFPIWEGESYILLVKNAKLKVFLKSKTIY